MTTQTQAVLAVFLAGSSEDHFGLEIARTAGLKSGTVYPILARLERAKWLTSGWEDIDPSAAGRPRRRYYRITPSGLARAVSARQETISLLLPDFRWGTV